MKFVLVYTSKLTKLSTIPFMSWRIVILWHTTSTFIFSHQQELSCFVLLCVSLNNTTLAYLWSLPGLAATCLAFIVVILYSSIFLREFDRTLKPPLQWACTMMWDINKIIAKQHNSAMLYNHTPVLPDLCLNCLKFVFSKFYPKQWRSCCALCIVCFPSPATR